VNSLPRLMGLAMDGGAGSPSQRYTTLLFNLLDSLYPNSSSARTQPVTLTSGRCGQSMSLCLEGFRPCG